MTYDAIQQEVQKLLEKTNFIGIYPTPVDSIATDYYDYKCLGFNPTQETENISGAVFHEKKIIYYNLHDNVRRQLFTIAHELGHIVLHKNLGNIVDYREHSVSLETTKIEKEANYFASEILMPQNDFKKLYRQLRGNLELLSDHFGTSLLVTSIRAKALRLFINGLRHYRLI